MLTTQTYTLQESIDELTDHIETLEDGLEDLDSSTDDYKATKSRKERLSYYRDGLRWQRDEVDWDADTEIELGAMDAGENALMHREATDGADSKEMRLWFVAASTVDAPYAGDDLSETFNGLSSCHPAFVGWAEAKANSLGVPGVSGNESEGESTSTS